MVEVEFFFPFPLHIENKTSGGGGGVLLPLPPPRPAAIGFLSFFPSLKARKRASKRLLPESGMPKLRRMDPRLCDPPEAQEVRAPNAARGELAFRLPRFPAPLSAPALVPALEWLAFGYPRDSYIFPLGQLVGKSPNREEPYLNLRTLVIENAFAIIGAEELEALLSAFPAVFPGLPMLHLHGGIFKDERVASFFERLPEASAAAAAAKAVGSLSVGGDKSDGEGDKSVSRAASASAPPSRRGRSSSLFRGVCRGCGAWKYILSGTCEDHRHLELEQE